MLVTYSIVLEIVSLCDFTPVVLLDISILPLFLFCVVIRRTNVEQQVTTAKPVSHLKPLLQNKEHVPRLVLDGHRCSAGSISVPALVIGTAQPNVNFRDTLRAPTGFWCEL